MTTARLLSVPLAALLVARVAAQPVNDNYANASLFDPASNSVTGTIVGATREAGEYTWFGYSVWWRWTAPTNGAFTIVAEADHFRPFLLIAPSGTNLLIGLTNSVFVGILAPNRFATEFPISANQETEYTIALFTHTNARVVGDYTLRVVASAPPVVTFVQPSAERTRHIVGEPLDLEADAHDADGQVARVDFFVVTPGAGSIPPIGSVSSSPYRVSAPTSGAIADRDARLFAVAIDDAGLFGTAGLDIRNQPDQLRFIAVRQPAPTNDYFDARVPLTGDLLKLEANNGGAGREAGEPSSSGEQTLWWSWTAPASKTYYVLARAFLSFPRLSVFAGNTLATLNLTGSDENSSCNLLAVVTLQAQAGQTYAVALGDSCDSFGGPFTLHILPTDAPAQIVDARIRRKGEVWNVPVFELLAVGMREPGWTVEYSDDLQSWTFYDDEYPYGWADGVSNWADTFYARINPSGSSRFYRLYRAY